VHSRQVLDWQGVKPGQKWSGSAPALLPSWRWRRMLSMDPAVSDRKKTPRRPTPHQIFTQFIGVGAGSGLAALLGHPHLWCVGSKNIAILGSVPITRLSPGAPLGDLAVALTVISLELA